MSRRKIAISVAITTLVLVLATNAGASLIGIYRNGMETDSQRGQIKKLSGENCGRGGSSHAFRMLVGKRTQECSYATPVVGRDLEIVAIGRLLSKTPKKLQRKAFISVSLRTGNAGAGYQLVVYPLQRKAQLRRKLSNGKVRYLRVAKNVRSVKGINSANELKLRAFNVTSGPDKGSCRIRALVGHRVIGDVTDDASGELDGRASGFSIGANGNAKGAVGSFDDVVLRVPNPF
ncbi:MAG TPA: hypothetical protein VGF04_07930 [Solirubrobacterales bacterium]|jgi:hypothetical protein